MIAIGLLFVRILCDCFKSRRRLEAEILICGISSAFFGSVRHAVDCICVGSTALCSFGFIAGTLASLML